MGYPQDILCPKKWTADLLTSRCLNERIFDLKGASSVPKILFLLGKPIEMTITCHKDNYNGARNALVPKKVVNTYHHSSSNNVPSNVLAAMVAMVFLDAVILDCVCWESGISAGCVCNYTGTGSCS